MAAELHTYAAFAQHHLIAAGPIEVVALKTKAWLEQGGESVLIFEDQSGQQLDLDLRGSDEEALQRLHEHPWLQHARKPRELTRPGRPKLGVVAREVTLLPRHWDWLAEQRGGASVTLRKLVEESMKKSRAPDQARRSREAAGKFMGAMAGNLPCYEEALRALTRKEFGRLDSLIAAWPADIREHVRKLIAKAWQDEKALISNPE